MTQNLADSTLLLHDHLVSTFLDLMGEGDEEVTADDIATTREIVDILVDALGLEVVAADGNRLTVTLTLPTGNA